jgi:hypothetical protein
VLVPMEPVDPKTVRVFMNGANARGIPP